MSQEFEFELVFALPDEANDPLALSDAVFEAGFEDALIGTGRAGLLAVGLDLKGVDAEDVILDAARTLIRALPAKTVLHEVRPDLVSLADVAEKLAVKRQAIQQRKMPPPVAGGLYRVDDVFAALMDASDRGQGKRRPRFNLSAASNWFRAGVAARQVNAQLTIGILDRKTLVRT